MKNFKELINETVDNPGDIIKHLAGALEGHYDYIEDKYTDTEYEDEVSDIIGRMRVAEDNLQVVYEKAQKDLEKIFNREM